MLARRLAPTLRAVAQQSHLKGGSITQIRTIFPRYRVPGVQYEFTSEYTVDGVPIVSNRPTLPEHLHPDPDMNGGYKNPPMENRADRSPVGVYWDQQGRRNWGEPVHEDDDILGRFSLHNYDYAGTRFALVGWGVFISAILGLTGAVYMVMPEHAPGVPREFPYDGLKEQLGGRRTVSARPEQA